MKRVLVILSAILKSRHHSHCQQMQDSISVSVYGDLTSS